MAQFVTHTVYSFAAEYICPAVSSSWIIPSPQFIYVVPDSPENDAEKTVSNLYPDVGVIVNT